MASIMRNPKYPRFMALIYSQGMDVKDFSKLLNENGYPEYNYSNVRKKLRGESDLNWDDIVVFSKVMNTSENIFFNLEYTKCIPKDLDGMNYC